MTRFHRNPQLSKLAPADARWLRGVLSETFPDGIPHSPFAVLNRLAARLELVETNGDQEWLRFALLQEIYRSLNRLGDALAAGEQAYQVRPWDPRSTYSLALTYQALTYGASDSTILTQSIGGLPLHRMGSTDAQAVESALAYLDLTEDQAAVRTLWLLQATLSMKLRRDDRRRVERSLTRLCDDWPNLKRPLVQKSYLGMIGTARSHLVTPVQSLIDRARREAPDRLSSSRAKAAGALGAVGERRNLGLNRAMQSLRGIPVTKWKYGGAVALVTVLLVGMMGAGIVLTSTHTPGRGGPSAVSAAEDPTTELMVFDQEGSPMGNPMSIYRDSPSTIIVALNNHADHARRYELSVRIDDEEWPLGTAEVQPGVRWDAGFQVTLSEAPKRGIEIVAQDAGTLALAKSVKLGVAVREAPVAVRATPEVTSTPSPSVTPSATVIAPRITSGGSAAFVPEPRPVIVPQAPANPPVSAPASLANTTAQRTATTAPAPTLPAQLPSSAATAATPTGTARAAGTSTPVPTIAAGAAIQQTSVSPTATATPRPASSFVGSTPTVAPQPVIQPTTTATPLPPSPFFTPTPINSPDGLPTPYPPFLINR